jgi:hypothetical protein
MSYRFNFRHDQCEFIIAAMDYIVARADERLNRTTEEPFVKFSAARTKERAVEIRDEIGTIIG